MLVFGLGLRMYLRICWGFQKDDRGEEQEASPQDDLDLKQSRLSDFLKKTGFTKKICFNLFLQR